MLLIVDNQKHNRHAYGDIEVDNGKEFYDYKDAIEKGEANKNNKEKEVNSQRLLINKFKDDLIKYTRSNQGSTFSICDEDN